MAISKSRTQWTSVADRKLLRYTVVYAVLTFSGLCAVPFLLQAAEPPKSDAQPALDAATGTPPSEQKTTGPNEPKVTTDSKSDGAKPSPDSRSTSRGRPAPETPPQPPKTERQLEEERKAREAARKRGEITFDDLKFNIEKGGKFAKTMITDSLKELDKKTVKLRGFILPTSVFQQTGIKQFVLVRDNQECCFGPGAMLYDCVIVEMAAGQSATFSTRVVTVKGKFEIDTESFRYPDSGHYAVFKMTAEEVK